MTATERELQRQIVDLFRQLGCVVYVLSQNRMTRQTPGLPDLYVFVPRKRLAFWFETKTDTGRLSEEQQTFRELVKLCNGQHIVGGWEAARHAVKALGLAAA